MPTATCIEANIEAWDDTDNRTHLLSIIEIINWEGLRVKRLKDYNWPQPTDITTKESWRWSDICATTHSCQVQMEFDDPGILIEILILYAWLPTLRERWRNECTRRKPLLLCPGWCYNTANMLKQIQKGECYNLLHGVEMWNRIISSCIWYHYIAP